MGSPLAYLINWNYWLTRNISLWNEELKVPFLRFQICSGKSYGFTMSWNIPQYTEQIEMIIPSTYQ
mgnify:CR=1 FL=1